MADGRHFEHSFFHVSAASANYPISMKFGFQIANLDFENAHVTKDQNILNT